MNIKDIYWVAGLLEGEGCFRFSQSACWITLVMTDLDTVQKAHKILRCTSKINIHNPKDIKRKVQYRLHVVGKNAVAWMMTLYTLMGKRRQEKILEILTKWKSLSVYNKFKTHCPKGHEYSVGNTRISSGGRHCKICNNVASKKYYAQNKSK